MQLCYRGVRYDYQPAPVEVELTEMTGKYRGLDWRFRNLKKPPILQPRVELTYRGVRYQKGGVEAPAKTAEPVKTPVLTIREKERELILSHQQAARKRDRAMLSRAAARVGLQNASETEYWACLEGDLSLDRAGAAFS